jgi:hypothetical protein
MLIYVFLLLVLSNSHLSLDQWMDLLQFCGTFLDLKILQWVSLFHNFKIWIRVATIIGKAWCNATSFRLGVDGGQLSRRKLERPIILLVGEISLEILFQNWIYMFRLAICFLVDCGEELWLDSWSGTKLLLEATSELCSAIWDDGVSKCVEPPNMSKDDICSIRVRSHCETLDTRLYLRKLVHCNSYSIISLRPW